MRRYYFSSSERYCKYLRSRGVAVGERTHLDPQTSTIDCSRPSLVSIGTDCYMNSGFSIITHDWVTNVFINSGREFLPSSGKVVIGNNVSFGRNVMVLKGVTIGDNCFIGAGSIVSRSVPANSVAVGVPCKVIMSIEEYYNRRKGECVVEALNYARSIKERFNRRPRVEDFWEEFSLFIDGENIHEYPEMNEVIRRQCGPSYESFVKGHKAMYRGFDEFLNAAGV